MLVFTNPSVWTHHKFFAGSLLSISNNINDRDYNKIDSGNKDCIFYGWAYIILNNTIYKAKVT